MGLPIYDPESGSITGFLPFPEKVCVITDASGLVVDIASRKENLSRGLQVPDFQEYDDIDKIPDLRMGDIFDGVNHTPDVSVRQADADRCVNENKIRARQRKLAVDSLIVDGELPADYE